MILGGNVKLVLREIEGIRGDLVFHGKEFILRAAFHHTRIILVAVEYEIASFQELSLFTLKAQLLNISLLMLR